MKIAIPVYGDHVSNVFDFAHRLLVIDVIKGRETQRSEIALENRVPSQRAVQLKNLEADVLICGGISQELAAMVVSSGIKILPFITGNVETVLGAFTSGRLTRPEFRMPGYWTEPDTRSGGRRRGCRWQRRRR